MKQPYTLTARDHKEIYEQSVRQFNESANTRGTYEHFLTRCFVVSFTHFLKSKNLVVIDGEIYVAKED